VISINSSSDIAITYLSPSQLWFPSWTFFGRQEYHSESLELKRKARISKCSINTLQLHWMQ